jgi:hypothetical protein
MSVVFLMILWNSCIQFSTGSDQAAKFQGFFMVIEPDVPALSLVPLSLHTRLSDEDLAETKHDEYLQFVPHMGTRQ